MCSINNCHRKISARGMCHFHYLREYRKTNPVSKKFKKCSVDNCTNRHSSHGLCKTHKNRLDRHGSIHYTRYNMNGCKVDECGKPSQSKYGYCSLHASRYKNTGNPLLTLFDLPKKEKQICIATGCSLLAESYKHCVTHARWLRAVSSDKSKTLEDIFGIPPYECYLCGNIHDRWNPKELWLDHLIPVASGGLDKLSNLRFACKECNQAKRAMSLEEFIFMCNRISKFNSFLPTNLQ